MVPRKGIDNFIRALSYLNISDKKVRLVIVGGEKENPDFNDDSEVSRLYTLAKELKVDHLITFAGRKDRTLLKYYYSAADIFITTPWYEPFGITPLEAMACGTPVIGANVGGIKYSVIDGKTGLLVAPKAPEQLADRIRLLINNPDLRSSLGKEALLHVNKMFTWKKVADKMDKVYESILNSYEGPMSIKTSLIKNIFNDAIKTFKDTSDKLSEDILAASNYMATALANGNKILICGNGGSAAESQHFAAELVGRFEIPYRSALPAIALTADSSILTAWSNDFGFEDVFARQVQAFGKKGDILVCLSTSGQSSNILKAIKTANKIGMISINLLGKQGGEAAKIGFLNLTVPSESSQHIQELHLFMIHVLCKFI